MNNQLRLDDERRDPSSLRPFISVVTADGLKFAKPANEDSEVALPDSSVGPEDFGRL